MLSFILNWYAKSPLSSQVGAIDTHGGTDQGNAQGNAGAMPTHGIDGSQGTRGLTIRTQAYASEVWSRAQQEVSKLTQAVAHKMQSQSTKLYSLAEKRNLRRAPSDIHATVLSKQLANRRELRTAIYEDAVGATREDLADTQFDLLEEAKRQQMNSYGRLKDQIILQALVQKVVDSKAADVDDDTDTDLSKRTNRVSPYGGVEEPKYQFTHYVPKGGTRVAKAATDSEEAVTPTTLTADLIEDVKLQFAKNDIFNAICCAAMPEIVSQLRRDDDFKNAENVYSPVKGSVDSDRDMVKYKDVQFIPVSEEVAPDLSAAPGGVDAVVCRELGKKLSVADSARTSATAVSGKDDYTVDTDETQVAYFWDKTALFFAERPDLMVARVDERADAAYAKQVFLSVSLGAALIDSRHAVVLHLGGESTAVS